MAIGLSFPFRVSSGSIGYFETTNTELAAAENNLRSLLVTNWGERPMHFYFGCNLRQYLFEQKNEELKISIADRISDQIKKWLPFLQLRKMNILFSEDATAVPENGIRVNLEFAFVNRPDLVGTVNQDII